MFILTSTVGVYWTNYSRSDGVALPNHELVGGDFLCFYVAGLHARTNLELLYDYEQAHIRQQQIIGDRDVHSGYLPFAYPPLLALLFAPLSGLSLQHAYLTWLVFSLLLATIAVILTLQPINMSGSAKWVFFIGSFAYIPFLINCLGGGQTSGIGLFIFALIYFFLKTNRNFHAGIALAFSYYKPPLFLAFFVFVLLHRRWKMLAGFCIMASFLIAGSIMMLGMSGFIAYLQKLSQYTYGHELMKEIALPPQLGVGLYAQLMTWLSNTPNFAMLLFLIISGFLILATYMMGIRMGPGRHATQFFDLLFALEVAISTLLSLQLLYYDLSVLLVPMIIVGSWVWKSESMDGTKVFSALAIIGLYTEFVYRDNLADKIPIKAATLLLLMLVVSLLVSVRRERAMIYNSVSSQ